MAAELRALCEELMEQVFNRGNYAAADGLVSPDFVNHEAPDSPGIEGFVGTARWLRAAFPDLHAELHEFVTDGELMVGRLMLSGTHVGEFMGAAGTGRQFSVQHLHMYRVRNGKLVEHWACRDDLGQVMQLGLGPQLAAAAAP